MATGVKEFKCEVESCNKTYKSKYNLERHVEIVHQNFKRFQCEVCSKQLSSKQNLDEHYYTHSKVKSYKCTEIGCSETFGQRSRLSHHKKFHEHLRILKNQLKFSKDLRSNLDQKAETSNKLSETCQSLNEIHKLPAITSSVFGVELPKLSF